MKAIVFVLGLVLVAVLALTPITATMATQGFKNPDKPWAPGMVYRAARVRMLAQQPGSAGRILQQALEVFPTYKDADRAVYWVARCHEKTGNSAEAIRWYTRFLAENPQHMWRDQAQRHMTLLKEQAGGD